MQRFDAPWTNLLKIVTGAVSLILVLVSAFALWQTPPANALVRGLMIALPVAAITAGAFFMVRGYILDGATLIIQRLGWETRLDLSTLTGAKYNPEALRRSFRLCGNGGFFSFTGWFRSKELGVYRFYGTDPSRAVILKFAGGRTIVITPGNPQEFLAALRGI